MQSSRSLIHAVTEATLEVFHYMAAEFQQMRRAALLRDRNLAPFQYWNSVPGETSETGPASITQPSGYE